MWRGGVVLDLGGLGLHLACALLNDTHLGERLLCLRTLECHVGVAHLGLVLRLKKL